MRSAEKKMHLDDCSFPTLTNRTSMITQILSRKPRTVHCKLLMKSYFNYLSSCWSVLQQEKTNTPIYKTNTPIYKKSAKITLLHKINSFHFRYTLYNTYKKTAIYACTHKRAEKKISVYKSRRPSFTHINFFPLLSVWKPDLALSQNSSSLIYNHF